MNIVVSAATLFQSGALTIYKQFIEHLRNNVNGNHYYIFVTKTMPQPEIDGVKYLVTAIRGFKRIKFDWYGCRKLMETNGIKAHLVISFQNSGIPAYKGTPQMVYYHQFLPLAGHKWNPLIKAERRPYFKTNIYPKYVKATFCKNTTFVVQAHFIKRRFMNFFKVASDNVIVCKPDVESIDVDMVKNASLDIGLIHLLYPAISNPYKRHLLILESMKIIKESYPEFGDILRLHLTLAPGQDSKLEQYARENHLSGNIICHGMMPHESLLALYKASDALIFPSTIETIGLPILEGAAFGLPVLVTDSDYAREALSNYEGAIFEPSNSASDWAKDIIKIIEDKVKYRPMKQDKESQWIIFFKQISSYQTI